MKTLIECSFREFWQSSFCDEFCEENEVKIILKSPKSKIVEDISDSSCMFGAVCLFQFYKKGADRWVKKAEVSDEEISDSGIVRLMGDNLTGDPCMISFDLGDQSFDFYLSEEQIHSLRNMQEYEGLEGYFSDNGY